MDERHNVLRQRTTTERQRNPEMAEAGARFESYVRTAMVESGDLSLAALARRSGIAASAWHGWFRGDRRPRRNSLVLASQALDRTPEQLLAAWGGERPHKPARATESGDQLVSALRDQTDAIRALVDEMREAREREQDAAAAILAAVEALRPDPMPGEDEASTEPAAPRETVG